MKVEVLYMNNSLPSLLIIDDSSNIRERLEVMIKEAAIEANIHTAGSFSEAVPFVFDLCPKIILLDLNLPDKNGIEILKLVRQNNLDAKVIVITNNAGIPYRKLTFSNGADYFIDKSNEFELVPDLVKKILN